MNKGFLKPDKKRILITVILGVIIFSLTKLVMTIGISFSFLVDMPSPQLLYPVIIIANILYWYLLSCLIIRTIHYKRKVKRKVRPRKKEKSLENVVRHILRILLVLNFICLVIISFINPEAYLFGEKLAGMNGRIYLLIGGIIGVVIAQFLFKKKSEGEILSLFYFGYFFIENLITNLSLNLGIVISPLFTAGLIVSIVSLVVSRFRPTKSKKSTI